MWNWPTWMMSLHIKAHWFVCFLAVPAAVTWCYYEKSLWSYRARWRCRYFTKAHSLSKKFCTMICFSKNEQLMQLWQVGKVWWEWYVFQRMKIVQNCLLNEWILSSSMFSKKELRIFQPMRISLVCLLVFSLKPSDWVSLDWVKDSSVK